MGNRKKIAVYLGLVLFVLLGCSKNQATDFCDLIELKKVNRADLLVRSDIKSNACKFDSLNFEWHKDTLLLKHTLFVKNTCGNYSLFVEEIDDTLIIDFVDTKQCELATIIELQAKMVFYEAKDIKIIKYQNMVLKR